jgi:hypothetical protein
MVWCWECLIDALVGFGVVGERLAVADSVDCLMMD